MKISIITVCYNAESVISKSITSVLAQKKNLNIYLLMENLKIKHIEK